MKGVSQLSDVLEEIMKNLSQDERIRMIELWPSIAGSQLYGVTEFWKVEDGVLYLRVRSAAAKNLVNLNSKRVIKDFNEKFPEHKVVRIRTSRMT